MLSANTSAYVADSMKISLIITTFNWKEALRLAILHAFAQSRRPDQIIIADDGSSDGTAETVNKIARESPVPIIYLWQEDLGFRAALSRNRAIAKAAGDYIVLIDGDILISPHFIEDHMQIARPGFFVQGSRVILGKELTNQILKGQSSQLSFFQPGLSNRQNMIRWQPLSVLFSKQSNSMNGIKTCNFAFWRQDAIQVNGFNEDFIGWGREDSEFAARLLNKGLVRKTVRFQAKAMHLYHEICSRKSLESNDLLLKNTLSQKLIWCNNGIDKHLNRPSDP